MKKKILFVHFSLKGKERWGRTFYLAKGLSLYGYEVTLLTSEHNYNIFKVQKELIDGVTVYSFPDILPVKVLSKGFGLFSLLYKVAYSCLNKFDFIYSDAGETPNSGIPCKINQWVYNAKYISEWSDMLDRGGHYDSKPKWFKFMFGKYYLWSVKYYRKSADYVVVLSSYMKDYATQSGIHPDKLILVPGGSMVNEISYYTIGINKSIYDINQETLTIGYIGVNFCEINDFLPIIDVIKKQKYKHRVKLLIYGHKVSNDFLIKNNLQDIIVQCGFVDFSKESNKLSAVDVFILYKPDSVISNAGWPNKLGDYMAVGRPIIVTPYGDITSFVKDNPEGFIVINRDENEINKVLNDILEGKYNIKYMGETNRKVAINKISWDARAKIISNSLI